MDGNLVFEERNHEAAEILLGVGNLYVSGLGLGFPNATARSLHPPPVACAVALGWLPLCNTLATRSTSRLSSFRSFRF